MKTIIISIMLVLFSGGVSFAQNNIRNVLNAIEENNTSLKALKGEYEAAKLENKTGISLSNPEIEFNYLWGSPSDVGTRKDFSITQSFDIPTLFGAKRRFADKQNGLIDLQYKQERIVVLLEAKTTLLNIIYNNALKKELDIRYQYAIQLVDGYKISLSKGDANQLELNKAELNFSTVRGEMQRVEIELNSLQANLKRLNGGIEVIIVDMGYSNSLLPSNFEDWYQQAESRNPMLQYVRQEIDLNKDKVKLSKAMGLPVFSAGFMSENVLGQNYKGVSIGLSIPLWANKNRVKQARASVVASERKEEDTKQQFYGQLNNLYNRTAGLQKASIDYKASLEKLSNSLLLRKALETGQISLLEYIVEIDLYYNNVNQALLVQRDYEVSLAELQALEL